MSDLSLAQNNPLLGTWKLISVSATLDDGTVEGQAYGSSPNGYITYTPEGRILVILSRSDRSLLNGDIHSPLSQDINLVTIAERAQAFSTFSAYAGTYSVSGNIVTHHIEIASIPNRVGTDLIRTFTLRDNQVTLKTPPTMSNGVSKVFELVWQRIES
ncbi:lipocalin-like domain-containing protein [Nostoc sp. LEGE 12450]|uniref:lipocalin-like domain-containing protein n=1 Tax=Nostoc sp. LEGE 12450 TaxID=1828643 RepID=UPI00187F7305|nr:lipocalin-like domain-containing protein [Nostoc sp. LEGE 12450]MBE8992449.1 lipocalin-like domain-containing protein [Nostoc sp. LEGE 12450]